MSQERVLKYLKEHNNEWLNIPIIVVDILRQDNLTNFNYDSLEVTTRRALTKLMWSGFVERKNIGLSFFYRVKPAKKD